MQTIPYERQVHKMRNRTILNRANEILKQLQKLQSKTEQLLRDAKYYESER